VSRCHARLSRNGDQFLIEDLGSAYRTKVDGQPVHVGTRIPIKPGQRLWLGGACWRLTVYRFSPHGDSAEGVGDLIGSVWEWTSSLYRPYPYDAQDGHEDPSAPGWRVLGGGSWLNPLTLANTTARRDFQIAI